MTAQLDDVAAKAARDYHVEGIMSEAIVIGIRGIHQRSGTLPHYYSTTRDGEETFGNGDKTIAFIRDELIPFVGKRFRAGSRKVFIGHSWSGQFLAYMISQSPEIFDAYFMASPAVHKQFREKTFNALKQTFNKDQGKQDQNFPDFIYVSVGSDEEERYIDSYESLTALLEQHLPAHVKLHLEINDGANHENNGAISIPIALKLYFSTTP